MMADAGRARLIGRLAENPVDPANDEWMRDAIDEWSREGSDLQLHEFLGWSLAQYREWLKSRVVVGEAIVTGSNDEMRWSSPHSSARMRQLASSAELVDEIDAVVRAWRSLGGNSRNVLFDPRRGFDALASKVDQLSKRWPR